MLEEEAEVRHESRRCYFYMTMGRAESLKYQPLIKATRVKTEFAVLRRILGPGKGQGESRAEDMKQESCSRPETLRGKIQSKN